MLWDACRGRSRHAFPETRLTMNCPVDNAPLTRIELSAGLPAFECSSCHGRWVRYGDYLGWRERKGADVPITPHDPDVPAPAPELATPARRCPDCSRFLTRYRVGHGIPFTLDQCNQCNGVWLDAAEWETLEARGLHDDLHDMFGPGWQHGVRTEEQRRLTEVQFTRQLGEADFARLREFGAWLAEHPRASEALAYLQWVASVRLRKV